MIKQFIAFGVRYSYLFVNHETAHYIPCTFVPNFAIFFVFFLKIYSHFSFCICKQNVIHLFSKTYLSPLHNLTAMSHVESVNKIQSKNNAFSRYDQKTKQNINPVPSTRNGINNSIRMFYNCIWCKLVLRIYAQE